MAEVRSQILSTSQVPRAWVRKLHELGVATKSDIFSIDAYRVDDAIEVIIAWGEDTHAFLGTLEYWVGSKQTHVIEISAIPRGSRIRLQPVEGEALNISGYGGAVDLPLPAPDFGTFAGKNTLFTVTTETRPKIIADWVNYHHETHGANAALVMIRLRPEDQAHKIFEKLEGIGKDLNIDWLEIVACDVPLGHPDLPDERCRHMAPDAPGKALLPDPEPDPWTSPVVELSILEVARRRFLTQARAVLFCLPADLIIADANSSVFDAATVRGFLKFQGVRAYPFTLKDATLARHGDHNCVSFDGKRSENIWCAAPSKLEPNAFWRQFRVSTEATDAKVEDFSYWRAMAVRHPNLKVSEIVPKSSLLAEPALTKLVARHFGTSPKEPPAPQTSQKPYRNDKILIVTTMKNEGPFILEWLAYHRAIGVTDFMVYTNDCTDGTDTMFDLLQSKGILSHAENPYREVEMKPQHAAYHAASETELARSSDWVICMDVDEFINVHVGDGTLNALFDAVPDATLISLTWRLFGNADIDAFEERPIIEQFFRCAPHDTRKPHQAWGFKTLFRNLDHYKKFGVHRPKGLKPEYLDQINWVNGSGVQMPDKLLRTGWRSSSRTVGYDLVTLNHYALRSAESFLVKRDRGRVNHVDRDQGLTYWFRMNHNAEEDRSIETKFTRFRAELARLMADPEIAAQHAKCVTAHKTRIKELMTSEEYQNLHTEITGDRLRTLSRMLDRFGNQTFMDGPDAIPQDFHLKDETPI